jgi:wyosine [tRNA(Phe)-imidazoG37] synthetase (radical SAM superfamily)
VSSEILPNWKLRQNLKTEKNKSQSINVYGPVPSRRLGFSLGIDIIPFKACTFNCIYCQLGRTSRKSIRRKRYFSPSEILFQIRKKKSSGQRIDFITFSGSKERIQASKLLDSKNILSNFP